MWARDEGGKGRVRQRVTEGGRQGDREGARLCEEGMTVLPAPMRPLDRPPVPWTIDYNASSCEDAVWSQWDPAQYAPVPFGDISIMRRDRLRDSEPDTAWYAGETLKKYGASLAKAAMDRGGRGLRRVSPWAGGGQGTRPWSAPAHGRSMLKNLQRYVVPRKTFKELAEERANREGGLKIRGQMQRQGRGGRRIEEKNSEEEIVLPAELVDLETLLGESEKHRIAGRVLDALNLLGPGLGVRVLRQGSGSEEVRVIAARLAEILVDEGRDQECQSMFKSLGDRAISERDRALVLNGTSPGAPRPGSASPLPREQRTVLSPTTGTTGYRRPATASARLPVKIFQPRISTQRRTGPRESPYTAQLGWNLLRPGSALPPRRAKGMAMNGGAVVGAWGDEDNAINVVNSLLKVAEIVRRRVPDSFEKLMSIVRDANTLCEQMLPKDHRKSGRVALLLKLLKDMGGRSSGSVTWAEEDALVNALLEDHVEVWGSVSSGVEESSVMPATENAGQSAEDPRRGEEEAASPKEEDYGDDTFEPEDVLDGPAEGEAATPAVGEAASPAVGEAASPAVGEAASPAEGDAAPDVEEEVG